MMFNDERTASILLEERYRRPGSLGLVSHLPIIIVCPGGKGKQCCTPLAPRRRLGAPGEVVCGEEPKTRKHQEEE